MFIDRQMEKEKCVCVCVCVYVYVCVYEYCSTMKKEILPFAAIWMNFKDFMLSEMRQRKTKKLYDLTYMWNLKKAELRNREQIGGC